MAFYTYIMASGPYGTLYVGHTDSITKRAWKIRLNEALNPRWLDLYETLNA